MNKYKIYCSVDGWVEVIASSVPTQCPVDNAHSVTLESATILEEDIYINDGTLTDVTLDDYKTLRYHDVDTRTNILALDNTRDDPALSYPIKYNTIDDLDSYDVIDATDLHNMYLTALATKKGHVDSGTVLKTSIRNAATKADVDAIIDNR
jgi:hypothetical protein